VTPIEIITQGEWKHACFTTYALSLSFFESQLLKEGLYRNGCRDIQILTDVKGYQMSLSERQSQRVGNEYRLVPARLKNGVFHPKVVYLSGDEDDVLLVSSGNLTFGGYGRNVECLEVFRKSENAAVFADYADLLSALNERADLWLPNSSGFETTMALARDSVATEVPDFPSIARILHSVRRPIGEQIAELIAPLGDVQEVRVLSPFFDPTAKGILHFTKLLNCTKLVVGLLPEREGRTSFDFQKIRDSEVNISAAHVACEEPRNLHAKWLEILMADGRRVVVSGSVNATNKSLMTADNVEAAIIRLVDDDRLYDLGWEPTELPKSHEPCEFRAGELDRKFLTVEASLSHDGRLSGEVAGGGDSVCTCSMILSRRDGFFVEYPEVPTVDGKFDIRIEAHEAFATAAGLQVKVQSGDAVGSAWVNVEALLQATRRGFISPSTLDKIFNSDAGDDDYVELIRYLGARGHQHLGAFSKRIHVAASKREQEESTSPDNRVLSVDSFATYEGLDTSSIGGNHSVGSNGSNSDALSALIFKLRQHLTQSGGESTGAVIRSELETDGADEAESVHSEKARKKEQAATQNALREFESHMLSLLQRMHTVDQRSAVFCLWIEGAFMLFSKRSSGPGEDAEPFARRWLAHVFETMAGEVSDALKCNVINVIVALAVLEEGRDRAAQALPRLHERLNRLIGREATVADFEEMSVFAGSIRVNLIEVLLGSFDEERLRAVVAVTLDTLTIEQQLELVRRSYGAGLPQQVTLPSQHRSAIRAFKEQVDQCCEPPVKRITGEATACPHCRIRLSAAAKAILKRDWFVECSSRNGEFITL